MPVPSPKEAAEFARAVMDHYRLEGRSFPWRETEDPWAILVSEVMLQQTQTSRVIGPYRAWMELWPGPSDLASASLEEVYRAWSGLGYNSRALRLRDCARMLRSEHGGLVPDSEASLLALPGVGRYTARAVLAFAFRRRVILMETNIRAALLFHFFRGQSGVTDRELEKVLEAVLEAPLADHPAASDPRAWYYALMDYGSWLKGREPNPSRLAAAYAKQSRFEGSVRQARGAALRALRDLGPATAERIGEHGGLDERRLKLALDGLVAEGLVRYAAGVYGFSD